MSETSAPKMTCENCGEPLGADVFIGPSGKFYCKRCRDHARTSSPKPKG